MDPESIAYFDEHFRKTESLHEQTMQQIAGLRQEIGDLRQETTDQIASLRQETMEQIRHTQILVEDMHGKVQLVAEGYFGVTERLRMFQDQVEANFKAVHSTLDVHYRGFETRIRTVEERTERKGRDPLDVLREMYDKGVI